jgi:hypothetical protein
MAEYIFVKSVKRRDVYINGKVHGTTNEILVVEPGTHEIRIAEGDDVVSERHEIRHTAFHRPKVFTFALPGDNNVPDYDSDDSDSLPGENRVPDYESEK